MTSAYSSMDPAVVSSLGQYDMHAAAAGVGRSVMLHSPPPHFSQQQQQQQPAPSHRQSPSTPSLGAAGVYQAHHHAAAAGQLSGYGAPAGPGGSAPAGYGVAASSTPGVVSPGAGTPTLDPPAKRDRDSIYGLVLSLASPSSSSSSSWGD